MPKFISGPSPDKTCLGLPYIPWTPAMPYAYIGVVLGGQCIWHMRHIIYMECLGIGGQCRHGFGSRSRPGVSAEGRRMFLFVLAAAERR